MKQAISLFVLVVVILEFGSIFAGEEAVFLIAYGAIALMAFMIAGTFLWLWFECATPLALGMVYSWSGGGLFAAWWWFFNLSGQPDWAYHDEGVFVVLGFYIVGAVLHFSVIHRSFGLHGVSFLWPVVGSLGLSTAVYFLT